MPAAPAAPKQQTTGDMFGDFQNGGAAASSVSKDSIMSLYNQPIAPTAAPPGYGRPGMPQGVPTHCLHLSTRLAFDSRAERFIHRWACRCKASRCRCPLATSRCSIPVRFLPSAVPFKALTCADAAVPGGVMFVPAASVGMAPGYGYGQMQQQGFAQQPQGYGQQAPQAYGQPPMGY